MKDLKFKASFNDSDKEIIFCLSDIVSAMGSQGSGDYLLNEEIGEDLAFIQRNWKSINIEIL